MVDSKIIQWWKVVLVLLIIRSYRYVYLNFKTPSLVRVSINCLSQLTYQLLNHLYVIVKFINKLKLIITYAFDVDYLSIL